jgi:small subunit ribosomal protein S14
MKYLNFKDKSKRELFSKFELERIRIKSIVGNLRLPISLRFFYFQKLSQLPRDASSTRIKNRCLITCNGHSVYRFFKLNRSSLREFVAQNFLNGVKKSSW